MPTRFERDTKAIEMLLRTAEKHFDLWDHALRSEDSSQPVVSYRNLVSLIAREAGYPYTLIADVMYHDHTAVRYGRNRAAQSLHAKSNRWWVSNKAALTRKWEEELGAD